MFEWLTNSKKVHDLEFQIRIFRSMLGLPTMEYDDYYEDIVYRIKELRNIERLYYDEVVAHRKDYPDEVAPKKIRGTKKTPGRRRA